MNNEYRYVGETTGLNEIYDTDDLDILLDQCMRDPINSHFVYGEKINPYLDDEGDC